jgi:xanthine dehydrogenase YagR molybdenum-binding subunit
MSEKAIGSPIDRVDGRLKVTGAALYAADAPVAGVTHGVIVPSLIARGRVQAIDADAARKAPGVVAVVTHENMPRLKQPGSDFFRGGTLNEDRLPLANDRIHYAGQYLAVVVAETPEQARHAASLVKVAYADEEPPPRRLGGRATV